MTAPKRPSVTDDSFVLSYDHAAASADTTIKLWKLRKRFIIDKVQYINVTGLAEDAANYFNIKVLIAAVVAANWSTETGQEGTIAANTFVAPTLAAAASRVGALDAEISLVLDEDGTATLPAGRIVIEGRYL